MVNGKINYALIIILLSSIVLSISAIHDGHYWGDDFALYLFEAKSFVGGPSIEELYSWNKISMDSSSVMIGPYLYPIGFPLLLSIVYSIFGMNFIAMKLLCTFFLILSIILLYHLLKKIVSSQVYFLLIVTIFALHNSVTGFSNSILSEFPYIFFSLLTFYLFSSKNTVSNQIILGLCLFYTYFIRDIGILLLPSLLIFQFLNSSKYSENKYLTIVPYAIFIALFFLINTTLPDIGENHRQLLLENLSIKAFKIKAHDYFDELSMFFGFNLSTFYKIAGRNLDFKHYIGYIIVFLIALGAYYKLKIKLHYLFYFVTYTILIICWPSYQGLRFMLPVMPFIIFFLFEGFRYFFQKIKIPERYQQIFLSVYFVFFLYHSITSTIKYNKKETNQAYTSESRAIYKYVAELESPNKIVGFYKPRALWFFSGVRSIYTDLAHFDKSIANLMLLPINEKDDLSKYKILKVFENYVLIEKK